MIIIMHYAYAFCMIFLHLVEVLKAEHVRSCIELTINVQLYTAVMQEMM